MRGVTYQITEGGASYGPTLRRKNLKFVRSTGLDADAKSAGAKGKGKEKECDRADAMEKNGKRGLYDGMESLYESTSIVAAAPSSTSITTGRSSQQTRIIARRTVQKGRNRTAQVSTRDEIDLTVSSDDDGYMNNAATSSEEAEEVLGLDDDEVIVLDSKTGFRLPARTRLFTDHEARPHQSRSILDLLPSHDETPATPPIQYGIESTNIGYKLLSKYGWKEGTGLGAKKEDDVEDDRLLVPLKDSNKMDKRGLGMATVKNKLKVKKKGKRERKVERLNRHRDVEDRRKRKEMLRYLNT